MTMLLRSAQVGVLTVGLASVALPAGFETAPTLQASQVLAPGLLKGPHHTIASQVQLDGFYEEFRVASPFGDVDAEGRGVLRTRLAEIDALARLSEVSETEVFAKAAGGAVLKIGSGVAQVIDKPSETIKGIGGGLKRFGGNLGRRAQRTVASRSKDDHRADAPERSVDEKATDATRSAAQSVLGVNASARKWAKELGVDPYTTNPVLHDALVRIGKIDAAGAIVAKVVVPIPPIVSATASVGDLVWSADPEALLKRNEANLAAIGTPEEVAAELFRNSNYTVTMQTRFANALGAVKAKGCADYVATAAEADSEREALFFVESAEMLAGLSRKQPVGAILEDSRAMVALSSSSAVALLPFDLLYWSERLAGSASEIAQRAKEELGAGTLEVRIAGATSPGARAGLAAAGWKVREGVTDGLAVAPVEGPQAR